MALNDLVGIKIEDTPSQLRGYTAFEQWQEYI